MRSFVPVLLVAASLQGCDRAPDPNLSKIERVKHADPAVMAERRAAGRWRSEAGILPGDPKLWVVLDVSGDQSLRVERRGMGARMEAVYASASGKVTITPEGFDAEAPDADGSLAPFRSFKASFPNPAKMLVTSGEQTFVFRYAGT